MKRKRAGKIFIAVLAIIGLLVFLTPYLLQLEQVRSKITYELTHRLDSDIDIKAVSWHWFPLPHLVFIDALLNNERLEAKVPEVLLFPDWPGLFRGKPGISRMVLDNPSIHLKSLAASAKKERRMLPFLLATLVIKNGSLILDPEGVFPCLKIKSHDKEMLFSCSYTELDFEKQGQQLHVSVNALEFTDPGLNLSGVIERRQAALIDKTLWHIDLKAKEVDLSGVREKVLALFGRHKVADLICNIVLGGKAKEAKFYLEGPVSCFRKLEAMTITADVDGAQIHVPNVDLDLKEACGQIEIKNGILTGQNLSARLDDSLGTNGSLALGLIGKDKVFKLDLDLDADLSKLPVILHRLVDHQGFRNELSNFSDVRGKTSGRLILGNRLKDISVRVEVSSIDGTADYQRITWPIKIKKGQLQVLPKEVNWSNIQGLVGPHSIHETGGSVRWKDDIFLDITRLNASLDSGPLFAELKRYPRLQEVLSKVLLSIDGPLEVTDAWLKGPVKKPREWKYSVTADTKGLDFHSPLLPGPSSIEQISIQADQENVRISSCEMRLSDQQINLDGDLKHKNWQGWQGWLDLSGTAKQNISQWIKIKGWIPTLYFPRTPCTMNHLKVAWDPKRTDVKGEIISDIENKRATKVKLDLSSSPKEFSIKDLIITTPNEKVNFSLNLQKMPRENLLLNWKGCLKGDTLDKILEENKLLSGYIMGLCNLSCLLEDPSSVRLKGSIEASDLNWHWGVTEPIAVKYANLAGHDSWTDIEELSLRINSESVMSKGRASFSKHNIDLDMDLKSDSLSWENLSRLLKIFKGKYPFPDFTPTPKSPNSILSLTGRINFELNRFKYTSREKAPSPDAGRKATDFVWQPLTGQVKLLPQRKMSISVSSGMICGLNTTGTWHSGPGPGLKILSISTDHDKKLLFQKVLSCFGFKQNILEGPFVFNANLEGTSDNWQRGTVELNATDGKIRRMILLSKIFSVLNVIDLFSKNGLPDLLTEGFPFSKMDINGNIKDNNLIIDHAIIKGKGLNLFGSGKIDLDDMDADIIVLVAPLKTIDTIVSKVPLLGKAIEGKDATIVTFPVKIKGQIKDPDVTVLSPDAVSEAMINLVKNTLMLPFRILSPIFP